MRKAIPFMALMKELSYIYDKHITKSEVFCKLFEKNEVLFQSWSLPNYHQEQNILILSIIIYRALYKIRLFEYAILIQENKHRIF